MTLQTGATCSNAASEDVVKRYDALCLWYIIVGALSCATLPRFVQLGCPCVFALNGPALVVHTSKLNRLYRLPSSRACQLQQTLQISRTSVILSPIHEPCDHGNHN